MSTRLPGPTGDPTTTSMPDALRLVADSWPAVETGSVGGWTLRAAGGFTSRANSALPLGDPGLPLPEAVEATRRWYAERDLPATVQIGYGPGGSVADDPVGAWLLEHGWRGSHPTDVMVARTSEVPPLTSESAPVTADAALSLPWLQAYAQTRELVPGVSEAVLTGSRGVLFLSVPDPARPAALAAIARMSIAPGWAGIDCLHVEPAHRREGLARSIVSAVAHLATGHAMSSMLLCVDRDNTPAVSLYRSLGFTRLGSYDYVTAG